MAEPTAHFPQTHNQFGGCQKLHPLSLSLTPPSEFSPFSPSRSRINPTCGHRRFGFAISRHVDSACVICHSLAAVFIRPFSHPPHHPRQKQNWTRSSRSAWIVVKKTKLQANFIAHYVVYLPYKVYQKRKLTDQLTLGTPFFLPALQRNPIDHCMRMPK